LYIINNEKLTGAYASLGLEIAGVETFPRGSKSTDWSFQVLVILQEIRSVWWQPELLQWTSI